MLFTQDKRIALTSANDAPARKIGQQEAGGQNVYVLQVELALSTRLSHLYSNSLVQSAPGSENKL